MIRHWRAATLVILAATVLRADTEIPTQVTTNTTWTAAGSPYVSSSSSVSINAGVTLTIEPGVVAQFCTYCTLSVNGRIIANGTSTDPITLTGASGWQGLALNPSSLQTQLTHVVISGGGAGWGAAGLTIDSNALFDHVTVSGGPRIGVQVNGTASPTFTNSVITGNGGYGMDVRSTGGTTINNTAITNNGDSAIKAAPGKPLLGLAGMTITGNGSNTKNEIYYDQGTITGTETWANAGVPWSIGQIFIANGASVTVKAGVTVFSRSHTNVVQTGGALTLEPGVTWKNGNGLYINGRLTAVGTAGAPIVFVGTNGPQNHLWFENADSASVLEHAVVSSGGQYTTSMVELINSNVLVKNVTVKHSVTAGVRVRSGSPTISDCVIEDNAGRGLDHVGGAVTLSGTAFNRNEVAVVTTAPQNLLNLAGLSASGNTREGIESTTSSLGNVTLRKTALPWIIGNLTVPPGAATTIEPGVTVKVAGNLWVEGELIANGTADELITITHPPNQPWSGLVIRNAGTASVSYAVIGYADPYAVNIQNRSPVFEHVTFSGAVWNSVQVSGASAFPRFTHCAFVGTPTGIQNSTGHAIDARMSYWGAANGPSGSGPGSGVSIPSSVTFEPWLSASPTHRQFASEFAVRDRAFNPSIATAARFDFSTTQAGDWTLKILSGATLLRTVGGSGLSGGPVWDGKNESGVVQPNGTYTFELSSVSAAETMAPVRGFTVIDTNKQPSLIDVGLSEPFFSPNGDGVKETSTLTGTTNFDTATWRIEVKNAGGSVVRGQDGSGTSVAYSWDGKNGSGVVQPEGAYSIEAVVTAGTVTLPTSRTTVLDVTQPAVTVTSPTSGQWVSNVYQNGSFILSVNGSVNDTNIEAWQIQHGPGTTPVQFYAIDGGTANAPGPVLKTWDTTNAPGAHVLRVLAYDRAGNATTRDTPITVGHFNVTKTSWEVNTGTGGTATYTSSIPFTLNESLVLRNAAGTVVRTLFNGTRTAGTYNDVWDGKNDQGEVVPDGPYFYVATASEGGTSYTLDRTSVFRTDKDPWWGEVVRTISGGVNPFENDPFVYNYTLQETRKVQIVVSPVRSDGTCLGRFSPACSEGTPCISGPAYRAPGAHTFVWPATGNDGRYMVGFDCAIVLYRFDDFPVNVIAAYGTAPTTSTPIFTPALFGAATGAQTLSFNLSTFQQANADIAVDVISQTDYADGPVRRITRAGQPPGLVEIAWDGHADNGMPLAPGRYTFIIRITDPIGNVLTQHAVTKIGY
jgi:flagellar hook assembly protein FlgD